MCVFPQKIFQIARKVQLGTNYYWDFPLCVHNPFKSLFFAHIGVLTPIHSQLLEKTLLDTVGTV